MATYEMSTADPTPHEVEWLALYGRAARRVQKGRPPEWLLPLGELMKLEQVHSIKPRFPVVVIARKRESRELSALRA